MLEMNLLNPQSSRIIGKILIKGFFICMVWELLSITITKLILERQLLLYTDW